MNIQLIIAAAIAVSSFGTAWKIQDWRADAAELERVTVAQEMARNLRKVTSGASTAFEDDGAKVKTKIVTVRQEVDRVVEKIEYRNVCFDADGLRAHASAVRLTGNTSKPESPLPAASASK